MLINVTTDTITDWELNRNTLGLSYIPKIISFLGYTPEVSESPIKAYRITNGLTQKELAKISGIDPTTVSKIERGSNKITGKVKLRLNFFLSKKFG
jgi:DNA-binding XRE family transcriptional regulator